MNKIRKFYDYEMINVYARGGKKFTEQAKTIIARKSPEPKGSQEQTAAGSKKKKHKKEQKWRHRHLSLCTHNRRPVTYNGLHSYQSPRTQPSNEQCSFNP
jgi:hypothetical protein